MKINTQYVFNKNTYEVVPWYPELEIIRPYHKEFVFGINAELAEKLKDPSFAEKWLRTAHIVKGNHVAGKGQNAPADEEEEDTPAPDDEPLGDDELPDDEEVPDEFKNLGISPNELDADD